MNQRRRLECVVPPLAAHGTPGQTTQLVVDQRHQLAGRGLFVSSPRLATMAVARDLGSLFVGIAPGQGVPTRLPPLPHLERPLSKSIADFVGGLRVPE
jgi:hypothetical protein